MRFRAVLIPWLASGRSGVGLGSAFGERSRLTLLGAAGLLQLLLKVSDDALQLTHAGFQLGVLTPKHLQLRFVSTPALHI